MKYDGYAGRKNGMAYLVSSYDPNCCHRTPGAIRAKWIRNMERQLIPITASILLGAGSLRAASDPAWLDSYKIAWDSQSADARGSMPIGGGNIALNVWIEKDELLIYIGSPDSWSYRGAGFNTQMQTKLGRMRLKFTPVAWAKEFRQELDLASNSIVLSGKSTAGHAMQLRVWIDAMQPVVHLEGQSDSPLEAAVSIEYPTGLAMAPHNPGQTYGSLVREGRIDGDSIEWWERSPAVDEGRNEYIRRFHIEEIGGLLPNPMANRTMGGRLSGAGFVADGTGQGTYEGREFKSVKLKSAKPLKTFDLRASMRIAQDPTLEEWQAQVKKLEVAKRATAQADWKTSAAWWRDFWDRSRIVINPGKGPDDPAWQAGRNYQLFRALLASNRAGEFPTLFNGGPFTCEPNPDTRNWFDCQFMAQNQRLVYWPMLKSGDYDLLKVGLEYYRRSTDFQTAWAKHFWKIDGLAFPEGMGIYGSDWCPNPEGHGGPAHLTYHNVSGMEFAIMMLESGSYGGTDVRPYLPIALGYLKYYDQYYRAQTKRLTGKELDDKGHLVIFPGNAIEMYQETRNDTCTLSGLMALSKTLLGLPAKLLTSEQRTFCAAFRKTLPPLPLRERRDHQTLAPAESWKSASTWDNIELPELYPVFPFHIYGVGKPDLQLAHDTWEFSFDHPRQKRNFCWYQSLVYAGDLGLTEEARELALGKLLWPYHEKGGQSGMRYPAFYDTHGFCQRPDFDHGGCAMVGLQEMLMQTVDQKVLLFPAWPKDWDCEFKLHAPFGTTVAGILKAGKLEKLSVTPESRAKDVVNMLGK